MNKEISVKILEQTNIGLGRGEIRKNLLASGFDSQEVDSELDRILIDYTPAETHVQEESSGSWKSILFGILFIFIAIMRFARFSDSGSGGGSVLGLIGIGTAIALAIYYFTKKD
jgi:hypothetical protein